VDITVVICTHNRAELLGKMLAVLNQAEFPESTDIEILVIANACQDNTLRVIEHYSSVFKASGWPSFRWLIEPLPGKSIALNLAIQESLGAALCFIDDDQFVSPTFFRALSKALEQYPGFAIFCGKVEPDWDGSEPAWVHESGKYHIGIRPFPEYDLGEYPQEIQYNQKLPSGGNITVRRSVFTRAGVFSTNLGPQGHNLMGGEDLEFLRRAMHSGMRIQYIPALQQKHAVVKSRMATLYMMRKSYLRSLSSVITKESASRRLRPYMLWKPAQLALLALFSIKAKHRFYYLIRLAASYGELRGAFIK